MTKPLRIVFMGTPQFAVASLDALCKSVHQVVAVVTAPDKPASRGLKMHTSAVKDYALKKNLPLLQPENLKDANFIASLKALNPDLQVVVAFRMLPEAVWQLPPMGTINLHASLLPQYRGAAPINWAIINGEKETGITTFKLSHEIDTGDILMQEQVPITEEDDAGALHDKLMIQGEALLVKTVDAISDGTVKLQKQPQATDGSLKSAPKIYRNDCRVNWNRSAEDLYNFIRGLSPYPGAWTELKGGEGQRQNKKVLKIYMCEKAHDINLSPGHIKAQGEELFIGCKDGALKITELQLEGKRWMVAADFLRGLHAGADGLSVE